MKPDVSTMTDIERLELISEYMEKLQHALEDQKQIIRTVGTVAQELKEAHDNLITAFETQMEGKHDKSKS